MLVGIIHIRATLPLLIDKRSPQHPPPHPHLPSSSDSKDPSCLVDELTLRLLKAPHNFCIFLLFILATPFPVFSSQFALVGRYPKYTKLLSFVDRVILEIGAPQTDFISPYCGGEQLIYCNHPLTHWQDNNGIGNYFHGANPPVAQRFDEFGEGVGGNL